MNLLETVKNITDQSGQKLIEAKLNRYGDAVVVLLDTEKVRGDGQKEYVTAMVSKSDLEYSLGRKYLTWHWGHYLRGLDEALADYNERS